MSLSDLHFHLSWNSPIDGCDLLKNIGKLIVEYLGNDQISFYIRPKHGHGGRLEGVAGAVSCNGSFYCLENNGFYNDNDLTLYCIQSQNFPLYGQMILPFQSLSPTHSQQRPIQSPSHLLSPHAARSIPSTSDFDRVAGGGSSGNLQIHIPTPKLITNNSSSTNLNYMYQVPESCVANYDNYNSNYNYGGQGDRHDQMSLQRRRSDDHEGDRNHITSMLNGSQINNILSDVMTNNYNDSKKHGGVEVMAINGHTISLNNLNGNINNTQNENSSSGVNATINAEDSNSNSNSFQMVAINHDTSKHFNKFIPKSTANVQMAIIGKQSQIQASSVNYDSGKDSTRAMHMADERENRGKVNCKNIKRVISASSMSTHTGLNNAMFEQIYGFQFHSDHDEKSNETAFDENIGIVLTTPDLNGVVFISNGCKPKIHQIGHSKHHTNIIVDLWRQDDHVFVLTGGKKQKYKHFNKYRSKYNNRRNESKSKDLKRSRKCNSEDIYLQSSINNMKNRSTGDHDKNTELESKSRNASKSVSIDNKAKTSKDRNINNINITRNNTDVEQQNLYGYDIENEVTMALIEEQFKRKEMFSKCRLYKLEMKQIKTQKETDTDMARIGLNIGHTNGIQSRSKKNEIVVNKILDFDGHYLDSNLSYFDENTNTLFFIYNNQIENSVELKYICKYNKHGKHTSDVLIDRRSNLSPKLAKKTTKYFHETSHSTIATIPNVNVNGVEDENNCPDEDEKKDWNAQRNTEKEKEKEKENEKGKAQEKTKKESKQSFIASKSSSLRGSLSSFARKTKRKTTFLKRRHTEHGKSGSINNDSNKKSKSKNSGNRRSSEQTLTKNKSLFGPGDSSDRSRPQHKHRSKNHSRRSHYGHNHAKLFDIDENVQLLLENCKCHYLVYQKQSDMFVLFLKCFDDNLSKKMKDIFYNYNIENGDNNKNNSDHYKGRFCLKIQINFELKRIENITVGLINMPDDKCQIVCYDDTRSAVILDSLDTRELNNAISPSMNDSSRWNKSWRYCEKIHNYRVMRLCDLIKRSKVMYTYNVHDY